MSETTETGRMRPTIALIADDPFMKLSAHERRTESRLRRSRLRGDVPDRPIQCLSASERAGGLRVLLDTMIEQAGRPVEVAPEPDQVAFAKWLKRQEEIHPLETSVPKDLWFSICPDDGETIPHPRVEDIQKVVSDYYGLSRNEFLSHRRTRNIVLPRQIAMYLAKTLTLKSLPDIGRRFDGRDHTTVLHAVRKIETMMATDVKLCADIELMTIKIMALPAQRRAAWEAAQVIERAGEGKNA